MKNLKILTTMIITFFSWFLSPAYACNEQKREVLLIEPAFLHPPISEIISGAKRTVIAAGYIGENSLGLPTTSFLQPSWRTLSQQSMNSFVHEARGTLSQTLATLHPRFLRDEHQVIQVAIIDSTDPITASTILAPGFSEQFINIFGSEFLIAIPTANRIYIFSKLASPLETIAPTIRDDYKLSPFPISTEIFELGHGQLHAVGLLD